MKLDIKSWVILFLLGGFIIFFSLWYFKGDNTRKENKLLKDKIELLQNQRDSLKDDRNSKEVYDRILSDSIAKKQLELINISKSIESGKKRIIDASSRLNDIQRETDRLNKEIEDKQLHPVKRNGVFLIKSLGEKLNN